MKYFLFGIGAIGLAISFPMHKALAKEITLSSVEKNIRTDDQVYNAETLE